MVLKGFLGTIGGTTPDKVRLNLTYRIFLTGSGILVILRCYLFDLHLNPPTKLFL